MLKLNWFSPLPPARSGIAHYAMQVLPFLAKHREVVVWTDQDQVSPEAQGLARVMRYDPSAPPWRELNEGAVSIYHMGNQPDFHGGIWQVSLRQPGIVVLHDLCLHDFFFMRRVHYGKDRDSYLAMLERWYGPEGRQAGEAFCAGGIGAEAMAQKFPLTREAMAGALGVITHSRGALEEFGEVPGCPVAALNFPYVAAEEPRYRAWIAARCATPQPPYRLVVFGYLNRNRRLGALLEALAGLREREHLRLDICGQLWDESHIRAQIERLGLSSLVNLYGFLADSQVEEKLSTAHLAINLRYPSMGEASLSQLQFWDYGLPTMVTRTGWYMSLPEDAAAFVRPVREIEDIQAHLRAFLADPQAFRTMGVRGRRALENHDPEKYAADMAAFASAAVAGSARIPALGLAGRVGNDLSQWLHPAASEYVMDRASQEIRALCAGVIRR